ncbi:MAG: FMN-binding protein [Alphaproteobacteria bacterium]|nr:FMN-binding protein [Alphaproteobacteria bacterium]
MRARFIFIPVAAITISTPLHAEVYLTVEEAQTLIFPGAAFTEDFRNLTNAEIAAIKEASGVKVENRRLKAWRVSSGGWFLVDQVLGKHDYIPFALGIDANGAIKGIEILEYREAYGGEIRNANWRAQFAGKHGGASLKIGKEIKNISGATISSKHVTDGVRRLMATYAIVLAER